MSDEFPLTPEESLDSDEVRNDDGDETVDPPEKWIEARDDEDLDERLADEEPDVTPDDIDLRDADDPGSRETVSSPTTKSIAWIRRCTAASAARSTGRRRTATRSTTSSSSDVFSA